jgi:uncharacterized protein HemY
MNTRWFISGGNHSHLLQKELDRHEKKQCCLPTFLGKLYFKLQKFITYSYSI